MAKYGDAGVKYGTTYQYIAPNHEVSLDGLTSSVLVAGMSVSLNVGVEMDSLSVTPSYGNFNPSMAVSTSFDGLAVNVSMADMPVVMSPFKISSNPFYKTLRDTSSSSGSGLREEQTGGFKKTLRGEA